jgi:hypothetical protein
MTAADEKVVGTATSYMTPVDYTQRALVERSVCDKRVPPAAASIVGTCPYYYRPLHGEYWETVEKVSVSSAWEAVKTWAKFWDPYKDHATFATLLHRREKLIEAESTDSDWSRHGNFMMRHVGCGHKPPSYYVSYGYYYCSTYGAKLKPRLSEKGQVWLDNARWYLQQNMEDGLNQNMLGEKINIKSKKPGNGSLAMKVPRYDLELDDDVFTTFAFRTHPLAYLDGGLAELPVWDLAQIAMQPNIQEWADKRTLNQAVDAGKVVIPRKIGESDMDDPIGKALGRLLAK